MSHVYFVQLYYPFYWEGQRLARALLLLPLSFHSAPSLSPTFSNLLNAGSSCPGLHHLDYNSLFDTSKIPSSISWYSRYKSSQCKFHVFTWKLTPSFFTVRHMKSQIYIQYQIEKTYILRAKKWTRTLTSVWYWSTSRIWFSNVVNFVRCRLSKFTTKKEPLVLAGLWSESAAWLPSWKIKENSAWSELKIAKTIAVPPLKDESRKERGRGSGERAVCKEIKTWGAKSFNNCPSPRNGGKGPTVTTDSKILPLESTPCPMTIQSSNWNIQHLHKTAFYARDG